MLKNDKVSFKEVEDLENKYSDAVVRLLEIYEENEKKKNRMQHGGNKEERN